MTTATLHGADWRALDAGPAMDALISERVMGWRPIARDDGRAPLFERPERPGSSVMAYPWSRHDTLALQLVESMRIRIRRLVRIAIDVLPDRYEVGICAKGGSVQVDESGPTLALAVARAALALADAGGLR